MVGDISSSIPANMLNRTDADVESIRKTPPSPIELPVDAEANHDESDMRLRDLGYKSEFRRDMSLFGVLGISFCAIGILTGMSSAFQTGLFSGGPLGLFWGWNVRPALFDWDVILTTRMLFFLNDMCRLSACS